MGQDDTKKPVASTAGTIPDWTADYYRKERSITEERVQKALDSGIWVKLEEWAKERGGDAASLLKVVDETAQAIGIKPPQVYVNIAPNHMAGSAQTRDGRDFVIISEPMLNDTTDAIRRQLLAHEFTHIKHNDGSPEEEARRRNDIVNKRPMDYHRKKELRADLGSLSLGDPAATIEMIKKVREFGVADYEKRGKTEADYIRDVENNPRAGHPSTEERIKNVEAAAKGRKTVDRATDVQPSNPTEKELAHVTSDMARRAVNVAMAAFGATLPSLGRDGEVQSTPGMNISRTTHIG